MTTDLPLIPEYQILNVKDRTSTFTSPFKFYEDAKNRLDYIKGPWISRLKAEAESEEREERESGHLTSNWNRVAYRNALADFPHRIVTRFVTPWKDVE